MKKIIWLLIAALLLVVLAVRVFTGEMINPFTSMTGFGVWFGAFLTLCILSFLYDDNPVYRFAEHLFVGISAAYWMVMGFWTTLVPNLFGKLAPELTARICLPGIADQPRDPRWFMYFIPMIFGILLLLRLTPKGGHLSRWALAFILGTTAGLRLIAFLTADFMGQVQSTMISIAGFQRGVTPFSFEDMFWNAIAVIAIISGLIYFYFSKAHKGVFGGFSRIGIWVLMVTFGAGFGYTVMGRVALLVGRVEFLLVDWLRVL